VLEISHEKEFRLRFGATSCQSSLPRGDSIGLAAKYTQTMDRTSSISSVAHRTSVQLRALGLSRATTTRTNNDPESPDRTGPLGLTTVYRPVADAVADIIFVHGLGGGSHKTWTKNADPALFWPKEWLPKDTEFQNIRIHTFGYDSDWDKPSVLGIRDFATNLLQWITDLPEIASDTEVCCTTRSCLDPLVTNSSQKPLILVCHSMGGLVAKEAYVLARETSQYSRVGSSLRSIFFLATPHRGADLANTLSRILKVCPGTRPSVTDLIPASAAIQAINETFPRYSDRLQLHSFYETEPMHVTPMRKELIVKQESAVMGVSYKNESSTYLAADHRNVCKFESPDSGNYRAVRNAIAASLKSLTASMGISKRESFLQQQQSVTSVLGVSEKSEDDYDQLYSRRVEGSCEWITQRTAFQRWADDENPYSSVYWMTAKAGAGKSVLCAYLIGLLRSREHSPAFFFFGHEKKTKPSISTFLRSSAAQFASSSPEILENMCKICNRNPELAEADASKVWRKLFLECIFKHQPAQRYYWMIDGLDECKGERDLVNFIMQAARTGKFRIFVTSRTTPDTYDLAINSQHEVYADKIDETTTNSDIKLFLDQNTAQLAMRDASSIYKQVLEKSDGCFLWTRLALRELKQALTRKAMQDILDEVPSELGELYKRIIRSIFANAREGGMIIAIMEWTACSTRALTISELLHALRHDMNDELGADIRRFIENNCSELITIDTTHHVRMVHTTARDFLFSESNTVCRLDNRRGHLRLGMACLRYLMGPELASIKIRRRPSAGDVITPSPFANYATEALFEHIIHLHSDENDFATELVRFFKMPNVLTWIESLARQSKLGRLAQAGVVLRQYVARRMQMKLPLGIPAGIMRDNVFLDSWAKDLLRLVTKFGTHLRSYPGCITNLIAPFCPSDSAIHLQFASSNRAIKVAGAASTTWDDCAATIVLDDNAHTIACTTGLFAVGTKTGRVVVFEEQLCQRIKVLQHGEPVKRLLLGPSTSVLIAVGLTTINCWDTRDWTHRWSAELPSLHSYLISFELIYNDEILFTTFGSNEIRQWTVDSGESLDPMTWLEDDLNDTLGLFRRPAATALAADENLLAIVYRGEDVTIWDINRGAMRDVISKVDGSLGPSAPRRGGKTFVTCMHFSRAPPESLLLVVGYIDGGMNLYDLDEGETKATANVTAHIMASNNVGTILACGESGGCVSLWEFDTLKPLHRIQAGITTFRQLAFSADDRHLFGVQDHYCYVWDPPILLIQNIDEDPNSDATSVATAAALETKIRDPVDVREITCLETVESGKITFCGRDDGNVCIYQTASGCCDSVLVQHGRNVSIRYLAWDPVTLVLVSVDVSSRVLAHKLRISATTVFEIVSVMMDIKVGSSVQQLLLSLRGLNILVSTEQEDYLFSQQPDGTYSEQTRVIVPQDESLISASRRRWCTHPRHSDQLILIRAGIAKLHRWASLEQLTPDGDLGIRLSGIKDSSLSVIDIQACFDTSYLAVMLSESLSSYARSEVLFFPMENFAPGYTITEADAIFDELAAEIHVLVGTHQNKRLVYLDRKGWICSAASPSSFKPDDHDWHFFLPADWLSSVGRLQIKITPRDGTLIYLRRDEFISVRRGLEFKLDTGNNTTRRPSVRSSNLDHASSMNTQDTVESYWEKRAATSRGTSLGSYAEEGATDHHEGVPWSARNGFQ
jgi:pimeloyl-ACP methyl ester carboxylesterase